MRPDPSAVAGNGANGLNEANGTKRREPLSIEELLRKKKEQQEAESRVSPCHPHTTYSL